MATVLTVLQPWAWAIIDGPKRVENRSWPTHHRGRLYIHAGLGIKGLPEAWKIDWLATFGIMPPPPEWLHFGAILGHVDVVDCIRVEDASGNPWAFGPWCWVLQNPVALARPVMMPGKLSLWNVPDDLVADKS